MIYDKNEVVTLKKGELVPMLMTAIQMFLSAEMDLKPEEVLALRGRARYGAIAVMEIITEEIANRKAKGLSSMDGEGDEPQQDNVNFDDF